MDNIISVMIGSLLLLCVTSVYMWRILYNEKYNYKNFKNYLVLIILIIFTSFNHIFVNNFVKVFTVTFALVLSNYFIFKKKINEIIIAPLITQFIVFISESILLIIANFIFSLTSNDLMSMCYGTIGINIIVFLLSLFLIRLKCVKKLYKFLVGTTDNISTKTLVLVLSVVIVMTNFYAASQYYRMNSKYMLIINSSFIIIYSFIVFKMLEQKNRYIKISNKYNMTNTTLKELEQNVTRLKITNHENKNQLLTIRNMIKKGEDSKSLIKHIENIVNTKIKDDETLMLQTSTITNSMISSIVYSKMLTMKENDVDVDLIISRDIKDLYLSDIPDELAVEVCKIIGVYLDNALEEVSKYEEKIINIEFYAEKKTLCIAISNNFEGEIDFEKMDNPGYTTKENGHGYGLSLAREIIESNDKLSSEREIKDNIFKQILKIKM